MKESTELTPLSKYNKPSYSLSKHNESSSSPLTFFQYKFEIFNFDTHPIPSAMYFAVQNAMFKNNDPQSINDHNNFVKK